MIVFPDFDFYSLTGSTANTSAGRRNKMSKRINFFISCSYFPIFNR